MRRAVLRRAVCRTVRVEAKEKMAVMQQDRDSGAGAPKGTSPRQPLGVAVAGMGWMGKVHTQAYARVLHHFPQIPVRPELVAVADEVPGRAEQAAEQFGFGMATRDWREIAADPRVEAVSIATPNFLHREIGVAMAEAGKHIWIEKPVGTSTEDARAVADAVAKAG